LAALLGSDEVPTETAPASEVSTPGKPAPGKPITGMQGVKATLDTLDRADAALRKGDFAAYGALEKQAREQLKSLVGAKPAGK